MIKRKTVIALISIFTAFLILACGGGGGAGETAGVGGPEISPDSITEAVTGSDSVSLTSVVADSTTNAKLTGTTDTSGEVAVEAEVNTTIEGDIDTGTDQGTTTATGDTDNAGEDKDNSVTNTTDSTTISEDIAVILAGGTDIVAAGTTDTATETSGDTGSSSGSGSTTSQTGSTDSGSTTTTTGGTSSDSGSNSTGETAADSGTGTADSGNATTTVTGGAVTEEDIAVAAGTEDSGTGETVEDLENDEAVNQGNLAYTIDSSLGKWYDVKEYALISEKTAKDIKAQIAQLRAEIKTIRNEFKKGKIKRDEAVAQIKAIRKKIADLRASIGNGGSTTGGIVTYWAKQNLYLNIKGGQPGTYRLVIVAKNQGILPDDYDRFSFSVEDGSDSIASISVKASDKAYFRGSAIIKLDKPAGTQLNILWTNDAYLKDKYDANVNIKKVALIKIREPKQKVKTTKRFKGDQYSVVDGRWFFDKHEAYTFWADQVIGYTFKNMEEGQYEVTIEAANHGTLPLPKNYKEFLVEVDSEYDSATVAIPADEKHYKKETFTMNFPEGDTTVYFTWVNDSYKENSYDANIKIKSVKVKKIKKSNLTAYLLKTKPGNRVFILSAFLMISAVLLGIYMKNRKSEASTL